MGIRPNRFGYYVKDELCWDEFFNAITVIDDDAMEKRQQNRTVVNYAMGKRRKNLSSKMFDYGCLITDV